MSQCLILLLSYLLTAFFVSRYNESRLSGSAGGFTMRFGICTGIGNAPILRSAGYDYIEMSVAGDLIPDDPEESWATKRAAIREMTGTTGLLPEAFNSFVRSGKIVGPEADFARLERYVRTALTRAAEVGGKIIVFGSGGARNVPDGFDRADAEAQIVRFLHLCADAHETTGVTVVIEPLNRGESNILNTVAEGAEFVRRVDRPGVRNLADTYHMMKDGEPLSAVTVHGATLAHAHTAEAGTRSAPGTGDTDFRAILSAFRAAGYDGRLSIECGWKDMATEAGPALASLRAAYSAAHSTAS
ncbi:MAG: sugar phosphate isomerase/epimerase family protein [Capsulimonadales bacterium]|nr:sugar phosphate isomerase/epimerase family protein [Capsulimonadales bacterium]